MPVIPLVMRDPLWRHQMASFKSTNEAEAFVHRYNETNERMWDPKWGWGCVWPRKATNGLAFQTWGAFTAMKTLDFDIEEYSPTMVRFKHYGVVTTFNDDELFLITKCAVHVDAEKKVLREGFMTDKKYTDTMNQTVADWNKISALNVSDCD